MLDHLMKSQRSKREPLAPTQSNNSAAASLPEIANQEVVTPEEDTLTPRASTSASKVKQDFKTPTQGIQALRLQVASSRILKTPTTTSTPNMARQRPAGRHLVRWNDDLDQLLLLTIQSECNKQGINLPWDAIGTTLGAGTTGGAIVQHLAKLRSRRAAAHMAVPPPLRRGGGSGGNIILASTATVATSAGARAQAQQNTRPHTGSMGSNTHKSGKDKEGLFSSKENDNTEDGEWASNNENGKRRSARTKKMKSSGTKSCAPSTNGSGEDSDDDSPSKAGKKRKRAGPSQNYGVTTPSRGPRAGPSSTYRDHTKRESTSSKSAKAKQTANNTEDDANNTGDGYLAVGAPFLALEDEVSGGISSGKPSLIAKLPYGTHSFTMEHLQTLGIIEEGTVADVSDDSSDDEMEGQDLDVEADDKNTQDPSSILSYAHQKTALIKPSLYQMPSASQASGQTMPVNSSALMPTSGPSKPKVSYGMPQTFKVPKKSMTTKPILSNPSGIELFPGSMPFNFQSGDQRMHSSVPTLPSISYDSFEETKTIRPSDLEFSAETPRPSIGFQPSAVGQPIDSPQVSRSVLNSFDTFPTNYSQLPGHDSVPIDLDFGGDINFSNHSDHDQFLNPNFTTYDEPSSGLLNSATSNADPATFAQMHSTSVGNQDELSIIQAQPASFDRGMMAMEIDPAAKTTNFEPFTANSSRYMSSSGGGGSWPGNTSYDRNFSTNSQSQVHLAIDSQYNSTSHSNNNEQGFFGVDNTQGNTLSDTESVSTLQHPRPMKPIIRPAISARTSIEPLSSSTNFPSPRGVLGNDDVMLSVEGDWESLINN